jgi:hypothetical protein
MYRLPLLLMLLSPLAAAEEWEEVRSGPFEVWTNSSEKDARQLLVRLEQVRHVLGTMLGKQDPVSLWPIRVLHLKTKTPAPWTMGRDAWVSVLPQGTPPPPAWQREVVRMMLESTARRMPKYWEDGILSFLSTLDAVGPKVTLGTPPPAAERTIDWARIHFFVTNPEYAGRFRVLMSNLQNGGEEEVGYKNSFSQTKPELEKMVKAYFDAGQLAATTLAGRALSERDFYTKPLETERATAALADATGNPKLSPAGTLEAAEALGLKEHSLDWLKQAVTGGSKSARVHLEYGKALTDPKAKQEAFVEAAKKNPKWAQPYVELANMESTPERVAFYLKTATGLSPRDGALWQRLAKVQLDAKQFSDASKSWFSAELAAATPQEKAAVHEARRAFEEERLNREAAEKKRIADERQRELDRLRTDALNQVRAAEAKANRSLTPLEPGAKVEEWWDDKTPSSKITGVLQRVDCLGSAARVWIAPPGAKPVPLYIKDSGQVVIMTTSGEASFGCGVQKPARQATVEYKARVDSKQATQGDVVVIEFR